MAQCSGERGIGGAVQGVVSGGEKIGRVDGGVFEVEVGGFSRAVEAVGSSAGEGGVVGGCVSSDDAVYGAGGGDGHGGRGVLSGKFEGV